jgi:hypothetical protein
MQKLFMNGGVCLRTIRRGIEYARKWCMYDDEKDPQFITMVEEFYKRNYISKR